MIHVKDEAFIKQFGVHLRKLRKEKGLSQEQLAARAEIELSQIGRIERGQINTTISTLHRLAIALELLPEALLRF